MRPPQDVQPRSGTPIYDALYSEYRRLFRALPGDRSGEEDLGFVAFRQPHHHNGRHRGHQPALPPGPHEANRLHGM